jgi:molybdenum cofactor cytidylyltransferase
MKAPDRLPSSVRDLSCAAIILAAGSSSRLGYPKQLVSVGGRSLLRRTVDIAVEAGCGPIAVVLGFDATRMQAELAGSPAIFVLNEDWPSGMGSSLRRGVEALLKLDPPPANLILMVCDQLALNVEILRKLLKVHNLGGHPITASHYAERLGVPAIFSAAYFSSLLMVSGDRGARAILEENARQVTSVDFPGGAQDLDTLADLSELLR